MTDDHELTEQFFGVLQRMKHAAAPRIARLDVSMVQARALHLLTEAMPMRTLADALVLDPSNVTALVDRLEARGLVRRRPQPGDRRVKLLELTAEGCATRDAVTRELFAANPVFAGLSRPERAQLSALLTKLLAAEPDAGLAAPSRR